MIRRLIILLLIVGCAPKISSFYGINVKSEKEIPIFIIKSYSDVRSITIEANLNMDDDLDAWASYDGSKFINIEVTNDTKMSVNINPLLDECYFVDHQGASYVASLYSRPDGYDINPHDVVKYSYYLPIAKEDISYIKLQLGAAYEKNTIVLKRLPKLKNY